MVIKTQVNIENISKKIWCRFWKNGPSNNSNHFDEDDIYIEFNKHIIEDLRNGKIITDIKLAIIGISKKIVNLKIKFKKNYKSIYEILK